MDKGTGRAGESHIAKFLEGRGCRILKRNYRCRFGEIDIIAENDAYLLFVEVKTREEGSLVNPFEAVTPAKQQKIVLTAGQYLVEHPTGKQPRFDVGAVLTRRGRIIGEDYLENAFYGKG